MATVVVGVDRHPSSRDAVAFGDAVVDALDAELVLVHVYPHDPLADGIVRGMPSMSSLRARAEALLEELAATTSRPVRTVAVAHLSPVRGLHAVAAREHALLLVVGSSNRGILGRVLLGHTDRTLRHSPCAAAVAPRGLAARHWTPRTIAVGIDGSPQSQAARAFAQRIAAETGAQLRLVDVAAPVAAAVMPSADPPDWRLPEELQRAELDHEPSAVAGPLADTEVRVVDRVQELIALSREVDLLVLAGDGPRRVVREAICPVVVVPRSLPAARVAP